MEVMEPGGLTESEKRHLYSNLELLLRLSKRCEASEAREDNETSKDREGDEENEGSSLHTPSSTSTEQPQSISRPAASEDAVNEDRGTYSTDEEQIKIEDAMVYNRNEGGRQCTAPGRVLKRKSAESSSMSNLKKRRLDGPSQQRTRPRRETSVSNTFVTISLPVNDAPDLEQFLINSRDAISGIISRELAQQKALKYYITIQIELEQLTDGAERETVTPYLHSIPAIILESTDFNETSQVASDRLSSLLANFQEQGSGFFLQRLIECHVNIATLDSVGGSSYIPLPAYIESKRCCVNVKMLTTFAYFTPYHTFETHRKTI